LDAGPVTRIGTDIDVELDRPVGVGNGACTEIN
jgi:hypothetical protein